MLDSITCTELVEYILYSSVEIDGQKMIHEDFPGVSDLLNLISYPSPLCGIFQLSLLSKRERELLVLLSRRGYLHQDELQNYLLKFMPSNCYSVHSQRKQRMIDEWQHITLSPPF